MGKPKYGRGLAFEVFEAVRKKELEEPKVRSEIFLMAATFYQIQIFLHLQLKPNSSSDKHSLTYKKYFKSIGNSKYILNKDLK
ncbi:hypothetical protein [Fictibacillus arsenicus]|uniref:Uncharacterized protein n=1 Tax=Fictibacillus arsenicus TaxID=255247 RepID=A0A1V3GB41_9BACL|nr:hypothetical protein [Fictibacillus arsenicus]OOE14060.1 hypothetical protein UN64_02275 [Fictibacillus arsenicus]